MRPLAVPLLLLLCIATVATILVARLWLGPADLYEKDQPKTLAYTADVLVHGRVALPRDVIYQPATKPPLYNWLAAAAVGATGSWGELAHKSPSVIGALGVGLLLMFVSRTSWHGAPARQISLGYVPEARATGKVTDAWAVGALACAIWFAFGVEPRHGSTLRLMFLARPDMLQALFLTGAWVAATRAVHAPRDDGPEGAGGRGLAPAIAFWLCVIGGLLTKGPLVLLALAYAPLAARLVGGDWRALRRLRPLVGVVATVALVGAWLGFAHRADPHHVRHVMLGAEVVGRIADETPEGIAKPFWYSAMWFVSKGGPFAALAVVAAAGTVARARRGVVDPVALAAALWLAVLLVGLSVPAGKRMDYLLPTFAPAAYLAARLLASACRRAAVPVAVAGLLPLAAALLLARAHLTTFHESREHWSDRAVAFARQVRARVGDDEPLLVIVRGKHPLPALLGRHHGSALDAADLRAARWVVLPLLDTRAVPTIASELVPLGFETIETRAVGVLGLFDLRSSDRPTLDELIAAQRAVATWTAEENPYRSPGTGWVEDTSPSPP